MFTGIIESTGRLIQRKTHGNDQTLTIESREFNFKKCQIGDSISTNGVCLTAIELGENYFTADVSAETLSLTTLGELQIGAHVNLESALTPSTALGGHIVSGHVDGIATLSERYQDARSERFVFSSPTALSRYIAKKGSVTLDGISLTVNEVADTLFHVNIVPHTLERTNLKALKIGDHVNLEVDIIARYLERLLKADDEQLSIEKLKKLGF